MMKRFGGTLKRLFSKSKKKESGEDEPEWKDKGEVPVAVAVTDPTFDKIEVSNKDDAEKYYSSFKWKKITADTKDDRKLNALQETDQDRVLDLLLVLDTTSSMSPWIKLAKNTLIKIMDAIKEEYKDLTVRVAFVGYRDFDCKKTLYLIHDFSVDLEKMKQFIGTATAKGGGDLPEDLQGALYQSLKLNWRGNSIKMCRIMTDAPCHGQRFHSTRDDFEKGNPGGLNMEELMLVMSNREIDLSVYEFTKETGKMWPLLEEAYNQGKHAGQMKIIDMRKEFSQAQSTGEDMYSPTSRFANEYMPTVIDDVRVRNKKHYKTRGWI